MHVMKMRFCGLHAIRGKVKVIPSPVQGLYQDKPPLPFIPGSEVSGVVMGIGPKVKGFKQGDHVRVTSTVTCFCF